MKPIVLKTDNSSKQFLYIQLYETLKDEILEGEIFSGEKLPSLRSLSAELGISLTTIGQAYDQLMVEGYIYAKPQSGYYVANVSGASRKTAEETVDEIEEGTLMANDFIHDPSCFDFAKWKRCLSTVFNDYSDQLLFESDPQGEMALRHEISKYIYRSRGVNASPDRIVIGAGTQQITSHLSRILQRMDISIVSLETPGYLPVQYMFKDAGFSIVHMPVGEEGIDINRLPTNLSSAVYVSPSNQFPTGAVMPIGKRYELLNWAKDNGSVIIEDDYDSELRYFGKPVPALQGLDKDNRVVYLGSFSSTLFPAIKISYMVLTKEMSEIFKEIKGGYTQTCSKAEQLTLALFMERGHYYTGIKKLRTMYAQKLEKTLESFEKYGGDMIVPKDTKSGINLTINVKSRLNTDRLVECARKLGVQVVPIARITDQDTSALSFYYSQIPLGQIEPTIKELTEQWRGE